MRWISPFIGGTNSDKARCGYRHWRRYPLGNKQELWENVLAGVPELDPSPTLMPVSSQFRLGAK